MSGIEKESPQNDVPVPQNDVPISTPPIIDCDVAENAETTKRKLTSVVWNHFKKQKIDGVDKAICNYCEKKLGGSSKNGTKHLHEHFKTCPLRKNRDIKQTILNPIKKKDGASTLGTHTFDQKVSRDELARMIILHEYPLNMVEHSGFRRFSNSLNALFNHVSRPTIRMDIMKIYESGKTKTKNVLNTNQGRIAVTTDMWTSTNQKRGYMVVTAHYIDDSWILRNKIIRFMYVPSPHNAKTLSKELMECLVAWSIDRAHSNREKYLAMFEDIKDDDDDAGPSHVDFDA